MIEKASICLERVKYLDPLQHVDSSCSIHFVEHISPMLKKKENLNLTRISPVMGGDQILWHFLNLEKKVLPNVCRKIFWIHGDTFYVEGIAIIAMLRAQVSTLKFTA